MAQERRAYRLGRRIGPGQGKVSSTRPSTLIIREKSSSFQVEPFSKIRAALNLRVHVEETGDLIIRHVLANDEGKYQCVAHNMAATRESPAISLSVYGKFLLFSTCLSSHSVFSKKKFWKKNPLVFRLSLSLSLISFIYSVQTTFSSFSLSLSQEFCQHIARSTRSALAPFFNGV